MVTSEEILTTAHRTSWKTGASTGSVRADLAADGEDIGGPHVLPTGDGRYGVLHRAVGGEADDRPLSVLEHRRQCVHGVLPLGAGVERLRLGGGVSLEE